MHDFFGTVRLLDEPDAALDAKVTLDLNRVSIRSGDAEIGSWPHADVHVRKVDDVLHLVTDGETLVLDLEKGDFFLDLLGVQETPTPPRKRRSKRSKAAPASTPGVTTAATPAGLGDLRAKAAATYHEDTQLPPLLAIAMGAAVFLVLVGAALTWGPFRLMDPGSFPIGRFVTAVGGLGGLFGLYFAYFDSNRVTGSAIAIAAGVVTFIVTFFYARAANLGIGFMLAVLGSLTLIAVGAFGMGGRNDVASSRDDE